MLLYFVIKVLRFDLHYVITAMWGGHYLGGDPLQRRAEPHREGPQIHPSSSLPGPSAWRLRAASTSWFTLCSSRNHSSLEFVFFPLISLCATAILETSPLPCTEANRAGRPSSTLAPTYLHPDVRVFVLS